MGLTCQSCGHENRLDARYCGACGVELSRNITCPSCGAENRAGQQFCNACGADMHTDEQGSPPTFEPAPVSSEVTAEDTESDIRGTPALVLVTLVFAIAAFVRFFRLGEVPADSLDVEALFWLASRNLFEDGWLGLWSPLTDAQPTGLAHLLAAWIGVFGDRLELLRVLPASIGIGSVAVFFLFCRRALGFRPAVLGSLFLAIGIWHLTYSRLAIPHGALVLAEVGTLALLLSGLREPAGSPKTGRLLVAAGVVFGAGVYTHNAFFIFALAIGIVWLRELASGLPLDEVGRRFALFALPALVVALPYLGALALNAEDVRDRVRGVAVSTEEEYQQRVGFMENSRYIFEKTVGSAIALVWTRSGNEGPERLLDPVTGILVAIGLVAGLWRLKEREHFMLWALFLAAVVAAGATADRGVNARLLVALPAVFAYAGYAAHWILVHMRGRATVVATYAVAVLVLLFITWHNLDALYDDVGPDQALWTSNVTDGQEIEGLS